MDGSLKELSAFSSYLWPRERSLKTFKTFTIFGIFVMPLLYGAYEESNLFKPADNGPSGCSEVVCVNSRKGGHPYLKYITIFRGDPCAAQCVHSDPDRRRWSDQWHCFVRQVHPASHQGDRSGTPGGRRCISFLSFRVTYPVGELSNDCGRTSDVVGRQSLPNR
jgi:hypothetical protein